MAEELYNLSPEQVKKLGDAINGAKGLPNQQAEIIDLVIQGEIDINKLRMANMRSYFDAFSANLDKVARKFSSINDTCLIINEKLADSAEFAINIGDGGGSDSSGSGGSGGGGKGKKKGKSKDAYNIHTDEAREDFLEEADPKHEENQRQAVLDRLNTLTSNYYKSQEERENDFEALKSNLSELEMSRLAARKAKHEEQYETMAQLEKDLQKLRNLHYEEEEDQIDRITDIRLSRQQEAARAEINAYSLLRDMKAEIAYANAENYTDAAGNDTGINEAGALAAQKRSADVLNAYLKQQSDARQAYIARREREIAAKNGGILTKEAATRIQKEAAKKFDLEKKNLEKLAAKEQSYKDALAKKDEREELRNLTKTAFSAETTTERIQALKQLTTNEAGEFDLKKTMTAAALAVSDLAKQLEGTIDEIASFRGPIDTRLYGSQSNKKSSGSYWDQMVKDMTAVGAINPFYKQSDFANNIKELVDTGIAFNIQQRAFLKTISNKIATTFEVADSTLLRLVRIQQEDSTAGRMGMEAAMNAFLNQMYENTEYLKTVASSVRANLNEMESLMAGAEAAEVEFQVQKWMGSLYSVGMSQEAVSAISTALGQIAAGQVEGIINGGAGNLLVMAANDAGYSIADFLTDGITAEKTNILLENAVKYLAELAESAEGNKIVQQQLANVFGVKASDLRAATNLVLPGSIAGISKESMTYGDMISTLYDMAGSMKDRTSIAEMMTNFWKNGEYTLAGSMASNPVSYFIYKMAKVVDDAAGGIDLPFLNVMGFGVDLNTTVSDLMRVAAVGGGLLGSIGPLISGLGNSFSGRKMLDQLKFGTSGLAVTPRGSGDSGSSNTSGSSTSGSGYVGNSSGSDVKDSTIQESEDSKKQQMIEAKEEEEANKVDFLNETVLKIYELLDDVASGKSSFKVQVDGYGLTKSSTKSNAAMSGIAGLEGDSANNSSSAGGGVNTGSVGGGVDFGGWTSV